LSTADSLLLDARSIARAGRDSVPSANAPTTTTPVRIFSGEAVFTASVTGVLSSGAARRDPAGGCIAFRFDIRPGACFTEPPKL
jgi:hypothetical protein